jgi:hypothetical protein
MYAVEQQSRMNATLQHRYCRPQGCTMHEHNGFIHPTRAGIISGVMMVNACTHGCHVLWQRK